MGRMIVVLAPLVLLIVAVLAAVSWGFYEYATWIVEQFGAVHATVVTVVGMYALSDFLFDKAPSDDSEDE